MGVRFLDLNLRPMMSVACVGKNPYRVWDAEQIFLITHASSFLTP